MSAATYHVGDVFDVLRTLPDDSVDLVLTSPPFLALRSYLPDDHPDKGREIGQELTPAGFLDTLLALTAEWDRVLAPHGSIAVELGDTYSSKSQDDWPLARSMCVVPELYAASLSYGRNLLNGNASTSGRWLVRNMVRWCRPDPPVGNFGDRFTSAVSTMVVATKSNDRYFDLDACRRHEAGRDPGSYLLDESLLSFAFDRYEEQCDEVAERRPKIVGRAPFDYWIVSGKNLVSHMATWPKQLLVAPIASMSPPQVCRTCGEPRRRIVENTEQYEATLRLHRAERTNRYHGRFKENRLEGKLRPIREVHEVGWTDCGHNDYRRGLVLDPFAGSGTTLLVASGMGFDAVGIDIDKRNADLARERVGMFLEVVER